MELILSSISQGILWGILSVGLFISFRILNVADMTTEGAFPLGAAVGIVLLRKGVNPFLACVISLIFGVFAGLFTGVLISYCKIPPLLSGILTMTGLISINLRIMGQPNLNILENRTIFEMLKKLNLPENFDVIFIGILLVVAVISFIFLFFKTELGQGIIATGDNPKMAISFGISTKKMIIYGLMLSNGIVAFSGSVIAQYNKYADINSGIGTIVVAIAGIIIGEIIFSNLTFIMRLISVVCGSIIYRLLLLLVLNLKFINANDFKLISALIITIFLSVPTLKETLKRGQ